MACLNTERYLLTMINAKVHLFLSINKKLQTEFVGFELLGNNEKHWDFINTNNANFKPPINLKIINQISKQIKNGKSFLIKFQKSGGRSPP